MMPNGFAESRAKENVTGMAALLGVVLALLFAGCASVPLATQDEQPQADSPHGSVVVSPPADGRVTLSMTGSRSAIKTAPSATKTLASIPASTASAPQFPKAGRLAPEITKHEASPPFDLTSLEKRLKETQAIDVLAKIALRNDVDALLNQFRAFYQGTLKTSLAELRRPYDLLILKVLSLLQDNDPALATAVAASREAIWGILADPAKFAAI
jgi:hypothetical protein